MPATSGSPTGSEIAELREGLLADPPRLPARLFYDDVGSALFDKITEQPEYYQTRTEIALLAANARAIVQRAAPVRLAELGAGTAVKIGRLIDAMVQADGCWDVSLLDVNAAFVASAADRLQRRFPETRVRGLAGTFPQDLGLLGPGGRRMTCFFGSTIGNLTDGAARELLGALRATMMADDRLLVGFDLIKDPAILEAAYNDAAGLTAEFNRNILKNLGEICGVALPVEAFVHEAVYVADDPRIEMRLRATADVRLRLPALAVDRTLPAGSWLVTERCAKYDRAAVERLAAGASLRVDAWFVDAAETFALALLA